MSRAPGIHAGADDPAVQLAHNIARLIGRQLNTSERAALDAASRIEDLSLGGLVDRLNDLFPNTRARDPHEPARRASHMGSA
jgi:hypothetical protein